ncbi:SDR family oxidoreductase [Devosia sp.]|uniref:SDR family oxidoreductase n=1 Tax=Devosia sp. TaxID=1871048 RepID=UPI003A8E60A5
MELTGKKALVTGGGSGIGKAAALAMADAGADVALIGRTESELQETGDAIKAKGRKALVLIADISDEAAMQIAFDTIAEQFGQLDVVFANAGINGTWAPIEKLSYEDWNKTVSINLGGTFLTVHLAVPLLKQHGGSVIITASINGTRTFTTAGASAYSTTKAGQVAFAQMAALELAKHRIRVNVICPGAIESQISDNTNMVDREEARVPANYPEGTIPLTGGEPGKSEQVADLVCFLASDRSSHISGTPIWIDGAQSLLV